MRTDDLIVELARHARPITPLARPAVRSARWLVGAFLLAGVGVLLLGTRPDLSRALGSPAYLGRLITTLFAACFGAEAAFMMSVPGAEPSIAKRGTAFGALVAWGMLLSILLVAGGNPLLRVMAFPVNWPCPYKILALSFIPGLALFGSLRRAAPLQPRVNALVAAIAATTLGAAATQLVCPVDDPAHQLVGHFLAVLVIASAGALIGSRALTRRPSVLG